MNPIYLSVFFDIQPPPELMAIFGVIIILFYAMMGCGWLIEKYINWKKHE